MKIIKKTSDSISREEAHGGSGARKLYISSGELENPSFQAFTYGYLPVGSKFSWHSHEGIEEVMLVLKGSGKVRDSDGEYGYGIGDMFIFPQSIEHEIENTGDVEDEFIFIRLDAK